MEEKKQPSRIGILYLLLAVAMIAIIFSAFQGTSEEVVEIPTSDFVSAVQNGQVEKVSYKSSEGTLAGTYWKDEADIGDDAQLVEFTSTYVGNESLNELMDLAPETEFVVDVTTSTLLLTLVSTVLPIVLLIGVMVFFMSRLQGPNSNAMQFGKTKAKRASEDRPKVKFSDVAGIDEAVEELEEIKDFLANPTKYERMGAKIPHGVLLVGPPGTGKTLLARAVAGEAGVPFYSISGSDFVEMFVGVGASRVRDLFTQAKESAPSIIFIDEIDAVGRQRGAGLGGGHDEREQTLNQLLVEMDGFDDKESVILIAATNRPDILDPALLRPGRFDRQVTVDRPDVKGREQILKVHSAGKPLEPDVDFAVVASITPGFTGADLANLMNESALLAARRGQKNITTSNITESMERVIAGPERKGRVMTATERSTIAFHESGHAMVGHMLKDADPVHKITIIPRGQALGYTLSMPNEDRFLQTRNQMLDQLAVFLGGRVAEELFCEDITTGASNDLERATKMAREMVTRYGMSENLGTQVFGEANHEVFLGRDYADKQDYSAQTAMRIDEEVARLMREAHERTVDLLNEYANRMHMLHDVLIERETVEGEVANALLDGDNEKYYRLIAEQDKRNGENAYNPAATGFDPDESDSNDAPAPSNDSTADEATQAPAELDSDDKIATIEVPGTGKTVVAMKDGSTKIISEDGSETILPPVKNSEDEEV